MLLIKRILQLAKDSRKEIRGLSECLWGTWISEYDGNDSTIWNSTTTKIIYYCYLKEQQ